MLKHNQLLSDPLPLVLPHKQFQLKLLFEQVLQLTSLFMVPLLRNLP